MSDNEKRKKENRVQTKTSHGSLSEQQWNLVERLLAAREEDDRAGELETAAGTFRVLLFAVGPETYGMEISQVVEILENCQATRVPHTVSFLEGIVSWRGRMIPIINARKRLGHSLQSSDSLMKIIVVRDEEEYQGILVDATNQVVVVNNDQIEPAPPLVEKNARFIQGVCYDQDQPFILLNLQRFLEFLSEE